MVGLSERDRGTMRQMADRGVARQDYGQSRMQDCIDYSNNNNRPLSSLLAIKIRADRRTQEKNGYNHRSS